MSTAWLLRDGTYMAAETSHSLNVQEAIGGNTYRQMFKESIQSCVPCILLEERFLELNTHALEKREEAY
jgi:hypothetical protein